MRILVVPDKFKGTLTSLEAAEAIEKGWKSVRPGDEIRSIPMSDGGDGFGPVLGASLQAVRRTSRTIDAAGRPVDAEWWWSESHRTAVLETAKTIGLAMLPRGRFHPFELDTRGLSDVLKAIENQGAKQCWSGIGGSATNDAGFGMARALGWKFKDCGGKEIERWTGLDQLETLDPPPGNKMSFQVTVAVDVSNPLCGPMGASRIYGPQKGLREEDFAKADDCLERLARVAKEALGLDHSELPGAGAAGGLGFGFKVFLNAELKPGFEIFSRASDLPDRIKDVDLVVTAEGAMDKSTLMGKGVGEVAFLSQSLGVPCLGLAGSADISSDSIGSQGAFQRIFAIAPDLTAIDQAMSRASYWLSQLAEKAAREWPVGPVH